MSNRSHAPARKAPPLGQNFLVSTTAPRALVDALGDVSNASVLEIGPGKGVLTHLLAGRARKVLAIEVDPVLAASLQQTWRNSAVEVVCEDVLQFDITQWAAEHGTRLQVIGNLPYYISSPILLHLCAHSAVIDRAVLMTQREVAERIAAAPGSSEYGMLSAVTQMHATVETLFTLPPEAFSPPPKVFSTVIRLTMGSRFAELGVQREGFLRFLGQLFAFKRKTLANNLRTAGYDPAAVAQCGLDAQVRAEAVTLEGMARLFRYLQQDC